jgi:hypothetical protein
MLEPLINDPDLSVRRSAIAAAASAGSATALVADGLATAASALATSDADDPAREALAALIRIDDLRWRGLLIAAWGIGSAADDVADVVRSSGAAPDAELVEAVRARLRTAVGPADLTRRRFNLPASPDSERLALQRLLDHWGIDDVDDRLRASALAGDLKAAEQLWRRTGEAGPWLDALAELLREPNLPRAYVLRPVLDLGAAAAPLLPLLRGHVTAASEFEAVRESQGVAARLVWRLTDDPADVLPLLGVLVGQRSVEAIDATADLGRAAASLIPALRLALADPDPYASRVRLAAARALWRIGERESDLLTPALPRSPSWETADDALDLLVELRATAALPRLRELLSSDARIGRGVAEDEFICARVREAIAALEGDQTVQ